MKPRYLGPLIVVSRTKRGVYIVCELDGAVLHNPIAQFRVIPYLARKSIFLPKGFTDIGKARLYKMEEQDVVEEGICRIYHLVRMLGRKMTTKKISKQIS